MRIHTYIEIHIYVVRQIRIGVVLKLRCVKLKFESEMRQIDSSFARQIEMQLCIKKCNIESSEPTEVRKNRLD